MAEAENLSRNGLAVVVGASGGIGSALVDALERRSAHADVIALGRSSTPALDLEDEASIEVAARAVADTGRPVSLVIDATGILHGPGMAPEKALGQIDPAVLARSFAINATGPMLLMKHFLPLLPRRGRAVFVTLSARVGSIGDNGFGGWYGYRASKAALNQFVRTASIELGRRSPDAVCVALHPGTVETRLTAGFARTGLEVQSPGTAATRILEVIDGLDARHTGGFFDHRGERVPW